MEGKGKLGKYGPDLIRIVAGTMCMALAVNFVYEPLGMVTGGMSGLSIVIRRLTGRWTGFQMPVWLSNLLLNIPIFWRAWRIKGGHYMRMTLVANICFTAALFLIPVPTAPQKDFVLAAVVGGVLTGAVLGLVFSIGCSTGGTDLLGAAAAGGPGSGGAGAAGGGDPSFSAVLSGGADPVCAGLPDHCGGGVGVWNTVGGVCGRGGLSDNQTDGYDRGGRKFRQAGIYHF